MAGPLLRDLVLDAFHDHLDESLRVRDVLGRVKAQDPKAEDGSIRAKLSELTREGVVAKLAFGQYRLMEIPASKSRLEKALVEIVRPLLKPKAFARAVIWDATPYLAQAEDGAPGTRLVVEHPAGAEIREAVEANWSALAGTATRARRGGTPQTLAWIARPHGPLGELLWEPDTPSPSVIDVGVIIVPHERLGGTGLTRHGYRAPTHERILTEFLAEAVDAAAAHDILRAGLLHQEFSIQRAEEASRALGTMPRLWALLTAAYPQLPEPTKSRVLARVPAYVRGFLEAED